MIVWWMKNLSVMILNGRKKRKDLLYLFISMTSYFQKKIRLYGTPVAKVLVLLLYRFFIKLYGFEGINFFGFGNNFLIFLKLIKRYGSLRF